MKLPSSCLTAGYEVSLIQTVTSPVTLSLNVTITLVLSPNCVSSKATSIVRLFNIPTSKSTLVSLALKLGSPLYLAVKLYGELAASKMPKLTRATPFSTLPTFSTPLTMMVTLPEAVELRLTTIVTLFSGVISLVHVMVVLYLSTLNLLVTAALSV